MRCQRCRKVGPPRAKFCPGCGAKLGSEVGPPIPQSPGSPESRLPSLEPALAAIARTAAKLCEARDSLIYLVDGDHLRLAAKFGASRDVRAIGQTITLTRGGPGGRSVLERRMVHVNDLAAAGTRFPNTKAWQQTTGWRTVLAMPLLRGGTPIRTILILRNKAQRFTPGQVALLKTFADQAGVAIENARLANELQVKNRDLSESLEQQTATSEILRVISGSPTDLQPVLDRMAESAAR